MIYFDNAATTRVFPEIFENFSAYQTETFFNPSASYGAAAAVKSSIEGARSDLLSNLHAEGKLYFVSSGTEGDNLALFGTKKPHGSRIIISSVEHPAVYNAAMELKQRGFDVVTVKTDSYGRVNSEELLKLLTHNTALVSIMHVNNETGAINDIKHLVQTVKSYDKKILFHSDGVQAVGKTEVNLSDLGVDLYTVSGHKIHAPKGIAALVMKSAVNIQPMIFGGGQESGVRSSTENVGGIMSFAAAIKHAVAGCSTSNKAHLEIKYAIAKALQEIDSTIIILSPEDGVPCILTFAMRTVRGEVMARVLESDGIIVGTGSACSSQKSVKRVPTALGVGPGYIDGIIRLSFSSENTLSDADYFIKHFKSEYLTLKRYGR